MSIIDLRSDTVILPTQAMREAIFHADLGGDVFSEDPTISKIEAAIRGDSIHFPLTRLICLENTQNRCYGAALMPDEAYSNRKFEWSKAMGK